MKICFAASAGGHLTQLLQLTKNIRGYVQFLVTTEHEVVSSFEPHGVVYVVAKANRTEPLRLTLMFVQCLKILFEERPDVVISTGAAVGCILCTLAKATGKRAVWIDSIANVDSLSLSGKIVRPFADVFLVQWPDLANRYQRTRYVGTLI